MCKMLEMSKNEENVIIGKAALKVPNISYGQYTLDCLRGNPIHVAQVDGRTGQVLTNRDILERSVKLATALEGLGVKVGDTIAISAENHINWFIAACAVFYCGAVLAPMNPAYAKSEIAHCLNIAKPKIIFVSQRSENVMSQMVETLPWPMTIFELDDEPLSRNVVSLKSILGESRDWPDAQTFKAMEIEKPAETATLLLYSSGTTGPPKGVLLSHRNIILQELAMGEPEFLHFQSTDVILTILPFFHTYGLCMVMQLFHRGATAITMTSFIPEIYLDIIGKYKVTKLLVVPPMMNFFAKQPIVSHYDYSSLKEVTCGAAPLLPEVRRNALKRLGNPLLRAGYGMTELTTVISLSTRHTKKLDSVGCLFPGASCKVIDQKTSRSMGPRQIGEMCFKGDYVMLGYKDNPKATAETIDKEGWLHTGDVGYYDEDGDLFIVGRLKELIKYKGFQVSPSAIESLLLSHPDVMDAAIIGIPDDDAGELPLAFVVKRPNSKVTSNEICEFVNVQVSPHSKIRAGVHFVNAIPKNPTGKILRKELTNLASKL